MVEPSEQGDWIKQKILGTGGFGTVILWKHKVSGELLALKKCRLANDPVLTDKHKERWRLEVLIMNKLKHPNIVRAVNVPDELNVLPTEMPVLAMEYCLKGDLRKVLNLPENCCGLPETTVRNVIGDISSAVEYLHSMRIIHRDLKPENVVLQDVNGKTAYKLIDLGYAKELDQGSLCTSFVGTLQYLAPELFMSQEYTCMVDYWSLGLLTHECAVGFRPFLPNLAPAEWMKYVCKKDSSDICVHMTDDKIPKFSQNLFRENHLSLPFIRDLENWLRLMLEWSPQKRGIQISSNGKQVIAFSMLQKILKKPVMHFFFVPTGERFSYDLNGDELTQDIANRLAADTATMPDKIECLDPRGFPLLLDKPAVTYCVAPEDEDDWLNYVFVKESLDATRIQRRHIPLVDCMLADKNRLVGYEEQRKLWSHAIYFIFLEVTLQRRLLQAYKVLISSLVHCNSQMMRSYNKLNLELNKLQAKFELFNQCLLVDKQEYQESKKLTITSQQMENCLNPTFLETNIDQLKKKLMEHETAATCVNTKTVGLQQSIRISSQSRSLMEDLYQQSLEIYSQLRSKPKDQRRIPCDNGQMLIILIECLKNRDVLSKKTLGNLQRVQDCKNEICQIVAPFSRVQDNLDELSKFLADSQINRQKILWNAFRRAAVEMRKRQNLEEKTISKAVDSKPQPRNVDESLTVNLPNGCPSDEGSMVHSSLMGIMTKSSEDSIIAIRQNQSLRTKLYEQFESLCVAEGEEMDWSYLEKMK